MRMSKGEKLVKVYEELAKIQADVDAIEAGNVNQIGNSDTDESHIDGTVHTRNAAGTSDYIPLTAKTANCFATRYSANAATVLGDGYTNAGFDNLRIYNCTPTGEARGRECKISVYGDMGEGSWAQGLYGKVTVGSSPQGQVDNAAALYGYVEATSPAAIGSAYGVYVDAASPVNATTVYGVGVESNTEIDYALDISGNYKIGAAKMPFKTVSPISASALATAFGVAEGSTAEALFMGYCKDSADSKVYHVAMLDGKYKYDELTDAS